MYLSEDQKEGEERIIEREVRKKETGNILKDTKVGCDLDRKLEDYVIVQWRGQSIQLNCP